MILVDISSILHRMIFGSTRDAIIKTKDNKYKTEDFIKLTLYYILNELINIQINYKKYGDIVICFDDYTKNYWRKDFYPAYKANRSTIRNESPIEYKEVFAYTNELFDQISKNLPWKSIYVTGAEADDVILVLAKEYYQEGVLILSPDKDFLQCQRLPNISQYSALTNKWMIPENKNKDMSDWIHEHVILGDAADGVPKITDHTVFTDTFKCHLGKYSEALKHYLQDDPSKILEVIEFNKLPEPARLKIIDDFEEKTFNRKGQETGYDIFENKRFGQSHLAKIFNGEMLKKIKIDKLQEQKKLNKGNKPKIKELNLKIKEIKAEENTKSLQENLDEFLDYNPLYREHYDRNFILVMEEGIPDYIRKNILLEYNIASTDYNEEKFVEYLEKIGLSKIKTMLPKVFQSNTELDISNCGW